MLHTLTSHSRALCLALISLYVIQSTASAAPEQFRTLGWQLSLEDLYYEYKGENTAVRIYESARSTFYDYAPARTKQPETATHSILFYRLGTNAEGEKIRIPIAQADLSKSGDWPLLIFRPDSSQTSGISVTAIPDDLKSFPAPNFRFVNLTPAPLEIKMGSAHATVKAKSMMMIDPKIKRDGTETRFTTITVNTPEGPRRIYSNNWAVRPSQRTMVLIIAKDGQLGVQRIIDDQNQYLSVLRLD